MAEENVTSTSTPSQVDNTSPSSAPEVPVSPVPENTPSVTVETPAPAEAVKTEAPTVEKKPETLLAGEKVEEPKAEAKPEEKKVEEKPAESKEAPKEEAKVEVPLPTYEPFKLPENVTIDESKLGEFTKSLAEFELASKASHEEVQKLGQQMMDRHIAELQRYTDSLIQAWHKQAEDWKKSFQESPEFANRHNTVLNAAIDAISIYGGNEEQQKEFRDLMESSKVGNHPAMIRMLSNMVLAKAESRPLAAPQIATTEKTSKIEKMYGRRK
jgi:hypothetical protein